MQPISDNYCVMIDVTSHCPRSCLYCSRYNRHLRPDQRRHMPLDRFIEALDSLRSWRKLVGVIGGEPLLHPQFEAMCHEIQKRFPRHRMFLLTSDTARYREHHDLIEQTFRLVSHNEHNEQQVETCRHQPLTLAIEEVVPDSKLREMLIDDCWVQRTWCPTINQSGAYFCEIGAAQDALLNDGAHAWPVAFEWWKKTPDQFGKQRTDLCRNCGMAIPIERDLLKNTKEKFTPGLLRVFREKNVARVSDDVVEVFEGTLNRKQLVENAKTWYPGNYRGDRHDDGSAPEGRGSTVLKDE
jgi:organic radical activating enzyme